ncbi:autophagocytosis associated protein, active-site protein [Rhizoctonia solani AG-3 Rhs1AP]|nr:autophagocytosis associated protein, active-site protein [Rhizoctonia solani AG-3 Rhs1AP]KEP55146.1 autophagocytosis associated protein, active-site protein [Rhizoctonia solani 123E]
MVPAYYFQAADMSGSPVSLTQVINTARFKRRTLLDVAGEVMEYGIQPTNTGNAQFPLLSYGDHPITGTPHWYFHPCETSVAVREILDQTLNIPWDPNSSGCLLRWFKAWLAVLTTAIDLNK